MSSSRRGGGRRRVIESTLFPVTLAAKMRILEQAAHGAGAAGGISAPLSGWYRAFAIMCSVFANSCEPKSAMVRMAPSSSTRNALSRAVRGTSACPAVSSLQNAVATFMWLKSAALAFMQAHSSSTLSHNKISLLSSMWTCLTGLPPPRGDRDLPPRLSAANDRCPLPPSLSPQLYPPRLP